MASPPIRIGGYVFDSATGELSTSGGRTSLRPQAAQVLSFLIARRGELVTRQDLNRELWQDGTWVDFAHGVTLCIYEIRCALGDDPGSPRYIETLPRRGYRFIAQVGDETDEGVPPRAALVNGTEVRILRSGENVIGRGAECRVIVDFSGVSRRHGMITLSEERATLEDLGSKNGTWKNGIRVQAPVALNDGDQIVLGGLALVFRSLEHAVPETADGSEEHCAVAFGRPAS